MIKENIKYYKTLGICCCLIASSIGVAINSSGVFYPAISESLQITQGSVSFSGTLLMICSAITSLFIPKLMERIVMKKMMMISAILAAFSTILIPIIPLTPIFYVCSALRGVSISFFSAVPITILMNHWFHKNYGLFTSIVLGCSGITSAMLSPLLVGVINEYGWQIAYICMGMIQLILCFPAILGKFTLTPQEQQIVPYGTKQKTVTDSDIVYEHNQTDRKDIINQFCIFLLFASFITAITGVCQHFTSICEESQMPIGVTAFVMTAVMLGNISFKFLIGFLSDRIGAFVSCTLMISINVFAAIIFMLFHTPILYLLSSYLFGAIYSVSAVGIVLLIKEIFGETLYSRLYPIVSFTSNIAMALAIFFVGFLYDITQTYNSIFVYVIILQCFNLLFLCVNRYHVMQSTNHKKRYAN